MDAGLENVVAAETVLSDVDGAAGRLVLRGHELNELAGRVSFEEVVHLLWSGFFQDLPEAAGMQAALGKARVEVFARLPAFPADLGAVEALRIGLAHIADGDDIEVALRLVAAGPVYTAAAARRMQGRAPVAPDPTLSHAADFLRMLTGVPANAPDAAAALDAYLVTIADHGLNASTFAARVVASTQAGLASATIAGLSALKGPLHGGAPGPVLDMIDAIGTPANAEPWIDAALTSGDRLMGFGHRVYRVRDPRADALKAAIVKLPKTTGRLAFAEAIESAALNKLAARHPTRKLETNVEFYTALLLEALQIPRAAFTCVFACGRLAGWIAHAREQLATGRLVRPQSVYVGPRTRAAA
ncbi:MAG: citrate synthase/methylcitrate synthase [Hyphomonadaceae bacterium]|nr:citrate synthase/methylcitrate synthase [Hyphomonadaceae bacterium]